MKPTVEELKAALVAAQVQVSQLEREKLELVKENQTMRQQILVVRGRCTIAGMGRRLTSDELKAYRHNHNGAGTNEAFMVGKEDGLQTMSDMVLAFLPDPSKPAACLKDCATCKKGRAHPMVNEDSEVIGRWETTGWPVYEGDDYVLDAEGCYLTRAEADALAEEDAAAPPVQGKEGGDRG
jgi:hypothetical protein